MWAGMTQSLSSAGLVDESAYTVLLQVVWASSQHGCWDPRENVLGNGSPRGQRQSCKISVGYRKVIKASPDARRRETRICLLMGEWRGHTAKNP